MPTVPAEIWVQYSIVAIFLVGAGLAAMAFYRLWRELLAWMELQDGKRELERKAQREWQTELSLRRDADMRNFMQVMQTRQSRDEGRYLAVLEKLTDKVDALIGLVQEHDTWERGVKYQGERRKEQP